MNYYRPFYFNDNLFLIGGRDELNNNICTSFDSNQNKLKIIKFNSLSQWEAVRMGRSIPFRSGFGIAFDENNL